MGFTPSLSAAVWLGHSEAYSPMNHQVIGGRYYATMYGSDAPAPLWKMYMDAALSGTPFESFPQVSLGTQPTPATGATPAASTGQSSQQDSPAAGSAQQTPARSDEDESED